MRTAHPMSNNDNNSQLLSFLPNPEVLAMMEAYNLSMDDMLHSAGLSSNSRWFSPQMELCIVLAFSLAIVLGLLGNVLVAFILCRRGNLTSPRHWYVLNLVVADILTCVFCVPFTLLRLVLKNWCLGEVLCQVAPFLQLTYVFVSVFTILAIAMERYRSIVCSTRLHTSSRRVARVVIPSIWLLAVVLALPLALTHRLELVRNVTGEVLLTMCIEQWDNHTLLKLYTVLVLLCQYAAPAAAIITLHLLICRFLRTRVHLRVNAKKNRQKVARQRKNLVLLTVISVTFALQWLPITVVNIMADFNLVHFPSATAFCLTYALCLFVALASVFVNPVIYGCFNSNIRQDFLVLCHLASHDAAAAGGSTRGGSSEATSRFYTTMIGSLTPSRHHSSVGAGLMAGGVIKVGSGRMSVDSLLHAAPSREVLQRFRKQRISLQIELK